MLNAAATRGSDMQRTRWLLIGLLILASTGCARRDWVSDLLVLADVTGTWEGSLRTSWGPMAFLASKFPLRWCFSRRDRK